MTFDQWWEENRVNTWVTVEVSRPAALFVWEAAQRELLHEPKIREIEVG